MEYTQSQKHLKQPMSKDPEKHIPSIHKINSSNNITSKVIV